MYCRDAGDDYQHATQLRITNEDLVVIDSLLPVEYKRYKSTNERKIGTSSVVF